jgi:transcriptional regulator with XRE-family HTH domain
LKFEDTLRHLLEEKDLSHREVATALGMAPTTLGNYVRSEREVDHETLKSIAAFFQVSIDYLLDNNNGKIKTGNENELLRLFRSMTEDQQELYIEQGRAFIIRVFDS